jgi:hypothetical protein
LTIILHFFFVSDTRIAPLSAFRRCRFLCKANFVSRRTSAP